jgi:hypothetical protein
VSTDVRNRGTQAFWAMHVEAMNWSGWAFWNTLQLCVYRPMRCANGATGWTRPRLQSTGPAWQPTSFPTDHVVTELQLYSYRPFQDEPDPRPLLDWHGSPHALVATRKQASYDRRAN